MQTKICAFTGHRQNKFHFGFDEQHKDCIKIKNAIREQICFLIAEGYNYFISGMALGVDQWAAEIVLELKIANPNIILESALPCITQASKWAEEQRSRYIDLLAKSDIITYVNYHYSETCMTDRNKYMADKADTLIAVLNEPQLHSNLHRSGTLQTVNYAIKKGKRVIIINPNTAEIMPLSRLNPIMTEI